MTPHDGIKRAISALALLAAFAATTDADAQRRRMPVRTEPIPETETAAERAAGKEKEGPANPSMMIYGPPTPVLGAPPAPAAAPAPRAIAAIAPAPAPYTAPKLDAKLVEQIFSCLAPGLPQDWKRTWVVVTSAEAAVAAKFFFTASYRDEDAEEFVPCNVQEITRRITGLSESLTPAQRRWKSARLAIDSEGVYELVYDYAK